MLNIEYSVITNDAIKSFDCNALSFIVPSPPENLLGEVVSPGTVRLKWAPPKNQNGIIRFYIIYYNADKTVDDYLWKSIQQNGE